MKRPLTLATLIALGAAAFVPLPSMAQTDFQVVISSAPPAPVYERVPAPRHGHVWAPGYWDWSGQRHHWVRGNWIAERPGYAYAPPAWQNRGGRWYMEQGQWRAQGRDRDRDGIPDRFERHGRGYDGYRHDGYGYRYDERRYDGRYRDARRDYDRDGIPNAYDRDLDNDGVSNRHDRDRDGDGVRNRRDARPDNPYRY
jgi:hypothetical protein